jgi:hypothetical protein
MTRAERAFAAYLAALALVVGVMAASSLVVAGSINSRLGPVGGCLEIRANCAGPAPPSRVAGAFDLR